LSPAYSCAPTPPHRKVRERTCPFSRGLFPLALSIVAPARRGVKLGRDASRAAITRAFRTPAGGETRRAKQVMGWARK